MRGHSRGCREQVPQYANLTSAKAGFTKAWQSSPRAPLHMISPLPAPWAPQGMPHGPPSPVDLRGPPRSPGVPREPLRDPRTYPGLVGELLGRIAELLNLRALAWLVAPPRRVGTPIVKSRLLESGLSRAPMKSPKTPLSITTVPQGIHQGDPGYPQWFFRGPLG